MAVTDSIAVGQVHKVESPTLGAQKKVSFVIPSSIPAGIELISSSYTEKISRELATTLRSGNTASGASSMKTSSGLQMLWD